jgi:PKD repeat protein
MQLNGWLLQDFIPTISFDKTKVDLSPQFTGTLNLTLDSAPAGLSGYNLTISLSNTSVATILSTEFPGWATLRSNSSLPGGSVWIKAADINELISSGANNVLLATLTIRGDAPGKANLLISVSGMDDDNGAQINPATVASQVEVSAFVPFPCEVCKVPTDPDGDGLYEDINGNGRKDFNDVVVFFNYLEWVVSNEPISNFDLNGNGRIDFNDIVKLFEKL